jgi:hypothetical protein
MSAIVTWTKRFIKHSISAECMIDTVKRGFRNPKTIPSYLIAKLLPASLLKEARNHQTNWKKEGDYITFRESGFAGGTKSRPEFCARNYYEISQMQELLDKHNISAGISAELGAGYGRLSPWISQFSTEHYGFEPNRDAISEAKRLYPEKKWVQQKIQNITPGQVEFDLIVTWTVLQHIPPEEIQTVVDNIVDISSDGAHLVFCEKTQGEPGTHTWPRSTAKYEDILGDVTHIESHPRDLEPSYLDHGGEVMFFTVS